MMFKRFTLARPARAGGLAHRRRRRALATVGALFLVAAALSSVAAARTTTKGPTGVLRIGVSSNPDGTALNPALDEYSGEGFFALAYAPIFHLKLSGSIGPALATSWHYVGRGNKRFEFTLRRDARFSDGAAVTARSVATWLTYFARTNTSFGNELGSTPKFTAVGRWTVRISLTAPTPELPVLLSDGGNNWAAVESPKAVAHPSRLTDATDGAGPYMFDASASVAGDHYVLVPNPYYYDKSAIKFREIYYKVITDPGSMLSAMRAGQLDVGSGDPSTETAARAAGYHVVKLARANPIGFLFDTQHNLAPALSDGRVRQAMSYAINRQVLARANGDNPVSELLTTDANPKPPTYYYPYDPAKARSLLAAAGYPNGFTISVLSYPGSEGNVFAAACSYLNAVGIKTNITVPTLNDWYTQLTSHTFALASLPGIGVLSTVVGYKLLIGPGSLFSSFIGPDSAAAHLYTQGLTAANPARYWKQMWAQIATQEYYMPLVAIPALTYVSKSIGGVAVTLQAGTNPTQWYHK